MLHQGCKIGCVVCACSALGSCRRPSFSHGPYVSEMIGDWVVLLCIRERKSVCVSAAWARTGTLPRLSRLLAETANVFVDPCWLWQAEWVPPCIHARLQRTNTLCGARKAKCLQVYSRTLHVKR